MSDTARDYQTNETTSIDGLDQIFEVDAPDIIEVRDKDANLSQVGREADAYLSVDEAAHKLKISVRAIQKRLKRGTLKGVKTKVGAGERWLIDPAEIFKAMDASEVIEVRDEQQEDANPSTDGREADAYLSGRGREMDAPADDHYKDGLIKELQSKLEGASYRVGYLEAKLEEKETQIRLLTDSQHKGSWWAGFKKWFLGQ